MTLQVKKLHPTFMAEVSGLQLCDIQDAETLQEITAALDQYAVLSFRDQSLDNDQQLAFAKRLGGELHSKTGARTIGQNRFGNEALTDISNIDAADNGQTPLHTGNRKRLYSLANRLWHTDASFECPAGRYSMLYAHVIPAVPTDTLFADMRTAYDDLDAETRELIDGCLVHHSIAYSRQTLGFEFSADEAARIQGAWHPLVRDFPAVNRRGLYLASHASSIEGMPLPEARCLIRELLEHATQQKYVGRHQWRERDLVIWDNRATMQRATRFDDQTHIRDLRRVTTLEIPPPGESRLFAAG